MFKNIIEKLTDFTDAVAENLQNTELMNDDKR